MTLQTAKGVNDVPPEEKIVKNQVVQTLKEVFELYGFAPLETPIMERYETLAAKFAAGEDSDALKETFQLSDQGKRKLALRFDLTVPLARYVAMNPMMKMPFKRYEMGVVFRDGPIKAGRVRQFLQCDVDTIGTTSMLADAEIIATTETVFNKLKLDTEIKVNNRKLIYGILEQVNIKNKEEAIIAIDKLDKIGIGGVSEELSERGYKKTQIKKLFELIQKDITLAQLKKKLTNKEAKEGISELEEVFKYLKNMGIKTAKFDVSLARGLAYYTGTVFEAFMRKGKFTSSLAGGGRWDRMIGNFMGNNREVPALGISFGITPIMTVMKAKNELKQRNLAKIYVVPIKTVNESLKIVQQLRKEGLQTDFDLNGRSIGKNLQYANSLGIPYAVMVGEKELSEGKFMLKNMETGDQEKLSVKDIVKKLKRK